MCAVRDADLNAADLAELARVLRDAPPNTSPRDLAARTNVPAASSLISIASKAGPTWIALLAIIVALAATYIAHSNATQAHRDAEQAHHDTLRAIEEAHADAERQTKQDGAFRRQLAGCHKTR